MYKVLSLDGGGIRGVLTATLLARLDEVRAGFVSQFDLIAGTSIGAILALGLAHGMTPQQVCDLFKRESKHIFSDSPFHDLREAYVLHGAKYTNKHLKQVLTDLFHDATLGDLSQKVLIASFDLDNEPADPAQPRFWKAKFFHNYSVRGSDSAERVVDVALRSAAAPIYFPTYQGYVDGFVVANNPSMCAVAQALSTKSAPLTRIALLSLGTGLNQRYFSQQNADWGLQQWSLQLQPWQGRWYVMPLVYMMWEASVDLANYECRQLLGQRFHRLDPMLAEPIDIDDVSKIAELRRRAQATDLTTTLAWIDRYLLQTAS